MKTEVQHYDKKKNNPNDNLLIKTNLEDSRVSSSKYKWLWIPAAVVVVTVLIFASWINFAQRPVSSEITDFKYFEIKSGESTKLIASRMFEDKLIRSKYAFWVSAKMSSRPLQAGYYKLSSSMPQDEIMSKLQTGETDAYSVTIPEGYRTLQIAKLIEEKAMIDHNKFIDAAIGKEGTLFPDTYMFPANYEPSKLVSKMRENFDKKILKLRPSQEQIVLASIVEREAKKDDERARIAAVYKNRSDTNMMMQADPTIRYALDTQEYLKDKKVDFDFWQPITRSDINNLISPFNTYKQKGLPPAPICNPGIKSLEAAVDPAKDFSDYYYFFHDKNLEIHFSKTLQEHQDAIKKFGLPAS